MEIMVAVYTNDINQLNLYFDSPSGKLRGIISSVEGFVYAMAVQMLCCCCETHAAWYAHGHAMRCAVVQSVLLRLVVLAACLSAVDPTVSERDDHEEDSG